MSNQTLTAEEMLSLLEAEVRKLNRRSRRMNFFGELSIDLDQRFPTEQEAKEAKERIEKIRAIERAAAAAA